MGTDQLITFISKCYMPESRNSAVTKQPWKQLMLRRSVVKALRHADIWGSGGTAPPFSTVAIEGGERSASCPCDRNSRGNHSHYSLDRRLGPPPSQSWHCKEEEMLVLARIEILVIQPRASLSLSLSLYIYIYI
jgi:hypothetical protein